MAVEPSSSALFVCPRCRAALRLDRPCASCSFEVDAREGIHDFLWSTTRGDPERVVEAFYTRRPFPGYAPADDANTLIDRSRSSPFLRGLDEALSPDATVLDCGSGTSQLAAFLALVAAKRRVVALDGCRASLREASRFRERVRIDNLALVRADLFAMPIADRAFSVVISRGVVHHTPDPTRAIECVARLVAPGGHLVLGFYENVARGLHRARRVLANVRGRPFTSLDPLLRRADIDDEKKQNWIEDQYRHPLEHMLPFQRVLHQLESLGFEWVRSVPPTPAGNFFSRTERPSAVRLCMRRLGWFCAGIRDEDAGLVALVVRRHDRS